MAPGFWIEQGVTRQRKLVNKRDKKRRTKLKIQPRGWQIEESSNSRQKREKKFFTHGTILESPYFAIFLRFQLLVPWKSKALPKISSDYQELIFLWFYQVYGLHIFLMLESLL